MSRLRRVRLPLRRARALRHGAVLLALAAGGLAVTGAPAAAAVGDTQVAWVEVEDGTISGGPAYNSGDHGNFSGSGSYTFREAGMRSQVSFSVPEAGTYPVWIRYAAGPLTPEENDRKMGLLTNGGSRQLIGYPLTGSWESWAWASATVDLAAGPNTLTLDCQRNAPTETCRLNFDAIQVGGLAPDTCAPTPVEPGAVRLFDGTFESFDQWRKSGGGGLGHQTDCTLRSFRGTGVTWTTAEHEGPYTLGLDWKRRDADDASSVLVGSDTATSATPGSGYRVLIGADDTATIVSADGQTSRAADTTALAAALHPVGQWNRFSIQATPGRIRVLLNGTPVNAVDGAWDPSGHIGLEHRSEAAQVDVRDVQLSADVTLGQIAGPVRAAVLADGTTAHPGGESTLGNLVADAQRWATRGPSGGNAKIAFVSPLGLDDDLVAAAYPGAVTYDQAAGVVASEPLVNMRLTGAAIKTVLEQQWQRTAADEVPTPAFVRLGASSGFTWTEDATRPEGDRVTGMWLDGTALLPGGTYSVTVAQSLAAGGDNFRGFTSGLVPQVRAATTVSALAAHLGDASAAGPLAAPATQRAVEVRVPGGAPSSYPAGTTYALDLRSWSYSAPGDPVDAIVDVSVAGRAIGSFAVDDGTSDEAYDALGSVAVRATLPADLPAGPATVSIVGRTTGTTLTRAITVTAAPAPDPTPGPTPEPTPTPTPEPTPDPVPARVRASLGVTVKPGRVLAQRTRAKVVVRLRSSGPTPTGKVTFKVGSRKRTVSVRRGKAVLRLPRFASAGRVKVRITYSGDTATRKAKRAVRIRVLPRS